LRVHAWLCLPKRRRKRRSLDLCLKPASCSSRVMVSRSKMWSVGAFPRQRARSWVHAHCTCGSRAFGACSGRRGAFCARAAVPEAPR
jgi:hypothetical protein